jgi:hypothetical protein
VYSISVYPIGVHLIGMYLTGVYFLGVHVIGGHLMGVYLLGLHLLGVDLMGVYLVGGCPLGVYLRGVQLSGRNCCPAEIAAEVAALILPAEQVIVPRGKHSTRNYTPLTAPTASGRSGCLRGSRRPVNCRNCHFMQGYSDQSGARDSFDLNLSFFSTNPFQSYRFKENGQLLGGSLSK